VWWLPLSLADGTVTSGGAVSLRGFKAASPFQPSSAAHLHQKSVAAEEEKEQTTL